MPQFENIARELLVTFDWHNDQAVRGILLIGSTAAGTSDADSDIDLVVIAEPIPPGHVREQTYRDAGANRAMIGFFRGDSPILRSNVAAVDKVWINGLQVDICFCDESEVRVYDRQGFVILKPCTCLKQLRPACYDPSLPTAELEARLAYSFRILLVHRDRYARWCKRRKWLFTDVSPFLLAARDMVLVLNGHVLYNSANPHFWSVMERVPIKIHGLLKAITDIKQLDDRVAFGQKLRLMDELIQDVRDLCSSRGIRLRVYDIEACNTAEDIG